MFKNLALSFAVAGLLAVPAFVTSADAHGTGAHASAAVAAPAATHRVTVKHHAANRVRRHHVVRHRAARHHVRRHVRHVTVRRAAHRPHGARMTR